MVSYISPLPDENWRNTRPRGLAILGSTGSIGCSALSVIGLQPERFRVVALAGARNIALLARQAALFRPPCLGILDKKELPALRGLLPPGYAPHIVCGQEGYEELARLGEASTVLSAQVGAAGLRATCAAVQAGKVVALANKESLVLAGDLIRATCARTGASILPVDSEHNALFQCLAGDFFRTGRSETRVPGVERLILTASGGPFYGKTAAELEDIRPEQALRHPNWNMGAKVTIDSATLMNKGLEIIEAAHLYGLPLGSIEVLVHRQSVVHSLVVYRDGSHLAQMGQPDMRIPIAHCLGWPERLATGTSPLDLALLGTLTFARPDEDSFPCLNLARGALQRGKGAPVVLNAANEVAVAAFLAGRLGFTAIPRLVEACLEAHYSGQGGGVGSGPDPKNAEDILNLDAVTRRAAEERLAIRRV